MKQIDNCSTCKHLYKGIGEFFPTYICENETRDRFNIDNPQIHDPESYGCIHWEEKIDG